MVKKRNLILIIVGLFFLSILIVKAVDYSSNGAFCGVVVYENSNILGPQDCISPNIGGTINNTGVVLDCQGNTVAGPNDNTGFGIKTNASGSNAVIKRCRINQFQYSINLSTNNVTIVDSNIVNGLAGAKDLWLGSNFNATFLNVTFTTANAQVSANSNLFVQYYIIVNVTNSSASAVNGANVSIYNLTYSLSSNLTGTTDSNGFAYFNLTDRVINGIAETNFTYIVNASVTGNSSVNSSFDPIVSTGRQFVNLQVNAASADTTPPIVNLLA